MKKRRQVLDSSVFLLAVFAFILTFLAVAWNNAAAECVEEHHGDLIIGANEVLTISDETFCIDGNIVIEANGHLVIRNVTLVTDASSWTSLSVQQGGKLELSNVVLVANHGNGYWINARDSAEVNIQGLSSGHGTAVGVSASPSSYIVIVNSTLSEAGIQEGAVLRIQSSTIQQMDMVFTGPCPILIEGLNPACFDSREFILNPSSNSYLLLKDTHVDAWTVEVALAGNLTIKNSTLRWVGFSFDKVSGEISGLRPGFYEVWELKGGGALECALSLQLINSVISEGWLIDFTGLTNITLSDSVIGRVRVYDTYVELGIRNVNLSQLELEDGVGQISFAEGEISEGMRFVNAMLTLEGEVSILPTAHIDDFRYSNVIRTYTVVVRTEDGSPAAGALVKLESPGGRHLSARTDDNGTTSFTIPFNDSNYSERWTLTVIFGGQTVMRNMGFMTSSPIPVQIPVAYNTTHNGS